jgi:hypothetical protein
VRRECIFFFKYFLKFFFLIIWLKLSLFDCLTEDWRYVCLPKKKLYKIFRSFKRSYIDRNILYYIRSFKRSYIDRNILYYNKNKIQIQMFVLFPNIFETKQYVTYLSNICFAILKMNLHCFSAVLQFLSNETDNRFVQ